ncbi:MAG: cytochrome c-type biogenesis protein [Pseudomonadota bacterium]
MKAFLLALSVLMASVGSALAVQPDEVLDDPVLEERARSLSAEIRCLVCQNESIDESNADLAKDLRILVRERLVAGDSDQQVLDFLVARYGDFVLLRPPVNASTALLWFGPAIILVLSATIILLRTQKRRMSGITRSAKVEMPLTEEEKERIQALLEKDVDPLSRGS